VETPIGAVPAPGALNLDGLDLTRDEAEGLMRVDRDEWAAEVPEIRAFFDRFGSRLPAELDRSLDALSRQLAATTV
jgi:phosphoenolpyruvate carboxykinase (GTP)